MLTLALYDESVDEVLTKVFDNIDKILTKGSTIALTPTFVQPHYLLLLRRKRKAYFQYLPKYNEKPRILTLVLTKV